LQEEVHLRLRAIGYLCMGLMTPSFPIRAQVAEPILTKFALPFGPDAGSVKLDFERGIGHAAGTSQLIPEGTLEMGVRDRLEILVRFPLLRVPLQPRGTVIGGGKLVLGVRYLLAGGADRRYAVSVEGVVEAPTGDSRLVGNATQVAPTVLADWRPASRLSVHSNLAFIRSIGGSGSSVAFLEYSNAITWAATSHFVPGFELVGSTNTITGRTEVVAMPELILRAGPHLEWKAGLQVGLNAETPDLELRVQAAWFWGRRQ